MKLSNEEKTLIHYNTGRKNLSLITVILTRLAIPAGLATTIYAVCYWTKINTWIMDLIELF